MMEYLQELTGMEVTSYSVVAAAIAFVMGIPNVIFLKYTFNKQTSTNGSRENRTIAIDRGDNFGDNLNKYVWRGTLVFSLLILPAIAFFFFGDVAESILSDLKTPPAKIAIV